MIRLSYALFLAVGWMGQLCAQTVHPTLPDAELPALVAQLDQRHFEAFNRCDIDTLTVLYAPDVEFFHDLNGRVMNREQFLQAVRKNICGKVQRQLLPGTMEVYPLAKVGVLQMGRHCFEQAGQPGCIQQGRFTILWRFDGAAWQVAKVFSYDHQPMGKP